jgi:hypothetical protein
MLSNVSLQQRRAAYALSQQNWWPALRELIDAELDTVHELMTVAMNPVVIHQLQGRSRSLREMRDLILTAGDVIAHAEAKR